MPTRYVLLTLDVPEEHSDLAIAALSQYPIVGVEMGMDSMVACFEQNDWSADYASSIIEDITQMGASASVRTIGTEDDQNWNAEWEKSIDAVIVNERIALVPEWRDADIHAPLKIIVTPKMSFGTGHHATTRMMCRLVEKMVKPGTVWMDVGTGTGVLAILAVKCGARTVYAFDNSEWSILNARENVERNGVDQHVQLEQIDLDNTDLPMCDGIAANLYRHLLIPNAKKLTAALLPGGVLLLSGILKYDGSEVLDAFLSLGCTVLTEEHEGEWCAYALKKTA